MYILLYERTFHLLAVYLYMCVCDMFILVFDFLKGGKCVIFCWKIVSVITGTAKEVFLSNSDWKRPHFIDGSVCSVSFFCFVVFLIIFTTHQPSIKPHPTIYCGNKCMCSVGEAASFVHITYYYLFIWPLLHSPRFNVSWRHKVISRCQF